MACDIFSSFVAVSTSARASPLCERCSSIFAALSFVRDIALSADETARWGRAEQRAYRALSEHSDWDDMVRSKLPDDVRAPFDLNVAARRAVTDNAALHPPSDPVPTLPAWTIVAPLPVDELLSYYKEAEAATRVPWVYLAAINMVETRFGRIVGPSSAGAVGPMQFLPSTWASCCVGNVLEPRDAIMGAAALAFVAHAAVPALQQGGHLGDWVESCMTLVMTVWPVASAAIGMAG
jgi:hypothetical protein